MHEVAAPPVALGFDELQGHPVTLAEGHVLLPVFLTQSS